jgi:putative ABC transport system permease protein
VLSVALAQVRTHAARMVATCLAIVIAVGFVVATLVLNASLDQTLKDSVAAEFVRTDAVLRGPDDNGPNAIQDPAERKRVAGELAGAANATTGVTAVDSGYEGFGQLRVAAGGLMDGSFLTRIRSVAQEPALQWQPLVAGRMPQKLGEVVVDTRADVGVGARVTVLPEGTSQPEDPDQPGQAGESSETPSPVTVVGITDLTSDPEAAGSRQTFVTQAQAKAWNLEPDLTVRVLAKPGTDDARLAETLAAVTRDIPGARAQTGADAADDALEGLSGDSAGLVVVLLVFAAIALFVAALVIANTFSVLVAQRTRELALLRCVGALGRQVRRSVLVEAAVVGVAASAAGVAAGIGLAALVRVLVRGTDLPLALTSFAVPVRGVVIGMVLGIVVTVAAAVPPARRATRIAPLAALRPLDPAPIRSARGLGRLLFGFLFLVPGALVLALAVNETDLKIGVPGGAATFLGIVLLGRRGIPPVVALTGRLASRGSVTREMATLGALRNPQRTAATATALLIGVTLTTAMVVGASSTRVTAGRMLDEQYPTDVVVATEDGDAVDARMARELGEVSGVAATSTVLRGTVKTVDPAGGTSAGEGVTEFSVDGVDPATAGAVVRSAVGAAVPQPGTIVVPRGMTDFFPVGDGGTVRFTAGGTTVPLRVHVVAAGDGLSMTAGDLRRLDGKAEPAAVWLRLDEALDADGQAAAVQRISATAAGIDPRAFSYGAVQERSGFDSLLTGLLLFVTGLLGVAVVIAVIGVGNTIALSVIERRQELGLLRALGLTRQQLRATLLWEALLIAGVAAALGTLVGAVYGAIGTICALGGEGPVTIDVPWLQVAAIVVVATLAGAAASVLPSRRAARVSPVAAIAAA